MRRVLWGVGILLAYPGSLFFFYPNDGGKVFGIPFLWAYFDKTGADYVGPLTGLALVANGIVWLLFPQIILSIMIWFRLSRLHRPVADISR